MAADYCPAEQSYQGFFVQYAIASIIIVLQLALLIQTLYQECSNRHNADFQRIKYQLRVLYIALQTSGLLFTVNEFIRFVIAPFAHLHSSSFCTFIASPSRPLFVVYYTIYIYNILLRLYITFRRSVLALSKTTFIALAVTAVLPNVITAILWFVWNNIEFCAREWYPRDFAANMDKPLLLCSLVYNPRETVLVLIMIVCVTMFNIIFTSMFVVKLNGLLSHSHHKVCEHDPIKAEFRALLIKICILTVVSSLSCIVSWVFWALFRGLEVIDDLFLYIDLLTNCVAIGLMFNYNDKHYKRLCKCCITLCWRFYGEEEPMAGEVPSIRIHGYTASATVKSNSSITMTAMRSSSIGYAE